MKKGMALRFFALLLFAYNYSFAQESTTAPDRINMAGIRISSKDAAINNSISFKHFFSPTTAVEGLFSFGDPVALGVLLEKHQAFGSSGLTWFYGAGFYTGFSGGRNFGVQGVGGLDYIVPTLPLNFSIDWKPELNITKQFSFEPAAIGFSARFVF